MKKNVWLYGVIAGLIVTAMMVVTTILCYNNPDFESSMALGFATMFLAFAFIWVGIKNVRDKYNNGVITFGKAFKIGLYISLIASTMYVAVWLVEYYVFIPDFMEKYTAHVIKEAKADNLSASELSDKIAEVNKYKEMYKSPILVVLLTYAEILPVGLIVSLICAMLVKRSATKEV